MEFIQELVRKTMAPQLNEAVRRGATVAELEAMMPRTTEEVIELLGALPPSNMPSPPSFHEEQDGERIFHSAETTTALEKMPPVSGEHKSKVEESTFEEDKVALVSPPQTTIATFGQGDDATLSASVLFTTSEGQPCPTRQPTVKNPKPIKATAKSKSSKKPRTKKSKRKSTNKKRSHRAKSQQSSTAKEALLVDRVSVHSECSAELNDLLGTAFSKSVDVNDLLLPTRASIHESLDFVAASKSTSLATKKSSVQVREQSPLRSQAAATSNSTKLPSNKNPQSKVTMGARRKRSANVFMKVAPRRKASSTTDDSDSESSSSTTTSSSSGISYEIDSSRGVSSMEAAVNNLSLSSASATTTTATSSNRTQKMNFRLRNKNHTTKNTKTATDMLWGKVVKREEQKRKH